MAAGAATGGPETPSFKAPSAAETAQPATPSNADETYNEQVAKAYHQLNTSLANDKETFLNAETAYNYQKALLAKEEPERYAANRWRGVREGISESGIQAGRIGGIAGTFALRGGQNLTRFQEAANRIKAAEEAQVYGYGQGVGEAAKGLNKRTLERLEKENPQTPEPTGFQGAYPVLPAQQAAINAGVPAGPGGVVPYGFGTGNVRVGPATAGVRRTAATKAKKR